MTKLKNHPYADLFPMMTAAELDALAADIAENGLRQPVVTYQGAVLDGRNRLLACDRAKVEPAFVEHEGDEASALALVISLNVQRRDLTAAQRALAAARCVEYTPLSRDGRKNLAAQFKVSEKPIQQAKAILAEAPDLVAQVDSGALFLGAAYDQLQSRRSQSAQKSKDAERASEYGAEYREAISNGQMTLDQALQEIVKRQREESERVRHDFEARQFWFQRLAEFIKWVNESVAPRKDDYLAWYTHPQEGEPIPDHGLGADRIAAAIEQLERVRTITFGEANGRPPGSQKTRSRAS